MKSAPPEFLFDAIATTALPCGNREVTANPVKVKLEAPKKAKPAPEFEPPTKNPLPAESVTQ
jgi:hypothetical protein